MADFKRLKDPIYGYIDIPLEYMTDIIDTAEFQRLRRIIQTSYSPLYSSAVHNRFVHSMGVYHLGEIASKQLLKEIKELGILEKVNIDIERCVSVFCLACLLHDVGHAPFSHTGEKFYLDEKEEHTQIHKLLIDCVGSEGFAKDVPDIESNAAAPHEIMSAIVGIKNFKSFLPDTFCKEFFARCIIGYKYSEKIPSNSLLNCFIALLNSNVIDVDKLDYLTRDAYITGYDTVNIDFERLLKSLSIIENDNGVYELAYKKNAISILENVVYAHDAEQKWIQKHPVVLYESYILQHIFLELRDKVNEAGASLFSFQSLGSEGISFAEGQKIKYLCDDDIIYLMKNIYPSEMSDEYFNRKKRRHPIWKSEAEYNALFLKLSEGGTVLKRLEDAMENVSKFLSKSSKIWAVNDELVHVIEEELEILEKEDLDEKTKKAQRQKKRDMLKLVKYLQKYAGSHDMDNNFIVLMASQFDSGFAKLDFTDINIVFEGQEYRTNAKVGKIVSSLKAREKKRDNFFYIFYKRSNLDGHEINKEELCKGLYREFV